MEKQKQYVDAMDEVMDALKAIVKARFYDYGIAYEDALVKFIQIAENNKEYVAKMLFEYELKKLKETNVPEFPERNDTSQPNGILESIGLKTNNQ